MIETKKVTYVTLETDNGLITIELLHAIKTQFDENTIQVTGTSYDIFAIPDHINR
ncbi:hypothetical protein [Shimazuella kribbensis]|uniref:hypothetical protein n=1 Tax=Shimazuella kribbensis TaxID=139808 RepID=UPI0012EB77EB|nr:hypothetical protein [Shimazuella kribbensis]